MDPVTTKAAEGAAQMDAANYDVVRARLETGLLELAKRADALNTRRKEIFGGTALELLSSERLRTENNCVPRDMVSVNGSLLAAYEVFLGLKAEPSADELFSVNTFEVQADGTRDVSPVPLSGDFAFLAEPAFQKELGEAFRYSKGAKVSRLRKTDTRLVISVQVGATFRDLKVFRFAIDAQLRISFMDARGEEDIRPPKSTDFDWTAATREDHVLGDHPHVSVYNELFVETIGGDLTFKVENNTESGKGIYAEPVDDPHQDLSDAEIAYARAGGMIVVRVKPYREQTYRYFAYAPEVRKIHRIDEIGESCVGLPEEQGIVYPGGYCLATGERKSFDGDNVEMDLERIVRSPNGEDTLYVYYRVEDGQYMLMPYNAITKEMEVPIRTNGMSLFPDGTLVVFRASSEPVRVHPIVVWRTPFQSEEFAANVKTDGSFLSKVGNRELVRGISDAFSLCRKGQIKEPTRKLYEAIIRDLGRFVDAYHWLGHADAFDLLGATREIRKTAESILDEFDKAEAIRERAAQTLAKAEVDVAAALEKARLPKREELDVFLTDLGALRLLRGKLAELKETRSIDTAVVASLDDAVKVVFDERSLACVGFLGKAEAFGPLKKDLEEISVLGEAAQKTKDLAPHEKRTLELEAGLSTLGQVISTLVIDDPDVRTTILEDLGATFAELNRARAVIAGRKKELFLREGKAEFAAQLAVLGQTTSSGLALADTPEKCDLEMSRVLLSLEDLEGKFGQVDQFVLEITKRRQDLTDAFGAKKQTLIDERHKRTGTLGEAANRLIAGVDKRARSFKAEEELFAYFASDATVLKIGKIAEDLRALGDTVRADEIDTRILATRQDALRALRDKQDLSADGADGIKLGSAVFSVSKEPLDLVLVPRQDSLCLHLSGTDFFEHVEDKFLTNAKPFWQDTLPSEAEAFSRPEFLAARILLPALESGARALSELVRTAADPTALLAFVRDRAVELVDEGYERGIHDADAATVLGKLVGAVQAAALLCFSPADRALGAIAWVTFDSALKETFLAKARAAARIREEFGVASPARDVASAIAREIDLLQAERPAYRFGEASEAARYLLEQLSAESTEFVVSGAADRFRAAFTAELEARGLRRKFEESIASASAGAIDVAQMNEALMVARWWVSAFAAKNVFELQPFADEVAVLFLTERHVSRSVLSAPLSLAVPGLLTSHARITNRTLEIVVFDWLKTMRDALGPRSDQFRAYRKRRMTVLAEHRERLKLSEFMPKILTSFVRNRLIDEVYLPLVGKNFAKQIGTTGADKRTDRMGLLLLLSPPGYGKTTLMEYVASVLGLIFMKVNGPALGHGVTSLDPAEAPNATAREEVQKVNLALEMGNNVMLYIDDIQHTSSEFLQKFISLCDAQRRIEGVWNGKTKTYDLRGKKFAVVMAGNPYTESGARFEIPDMLANRADTYNLGEVLEGKHALFAQSYLENALIANRATARLALGHRGDAQIFMGLAAGEPVSTSELTTPYAAPEITEITETLKRLFRVQATLLMVNREYILSAAQADAYRTEPPFKLQGSYRNMSKIAEKVASAMTDEELKRLIDDHYKSEAQTLTQGAEFNLLKLAELRGRINDEQKVRLRDIRETYARNLRMGGKEADPATRITGAMAGIEMGLKGIGGAIDGTSSNAAVVDVITEQGAILASALREFSRSHVGLLDKALATMARSAEARAAEPPKPGPKTDDVGPQLKKELKALREELGAHLGAIDERLRTRPPTPEPRPNTRTDTRTTAPPVAHMEVVLGPGQPSHFFRTMASNNVVLDGGLFVGTYARLPTVGARVSLELVFPSGVRAPVVGVVVFAQDLVQGETAVEPGFGVRLLEARAELLPQIEAYCATHAVLLRDL